MNAVFSNYPKYVSKMWYVCVTNFCVIIIYSLNKEVILMKRSLVVMGALVLLCLIIPGLVEIVSAQPPPPALPGTPNQAPIDGGLGLLAAAGGAYAWKKLRYNKNK
jgi:hypothetical protein